MSHTTLFRPDLSLKTRISLAVSALCILCIGLMAAWALALFETEKKASLSAEAVSLASVMADNVDSKLSLLHNAVIRVAATVPPEVLQDADRAQAFLDQQSALQSLFDGGLYLVSMERTLVAESPFKPGRRGRDLRGREFVTQTIASRKPYISKPFVSAHTPGQPAVCMTAPVFNQAGEMVGQIQGTIDLLGANVLGDLATRRIGQTGYLYMFNARETMISHVDKSRIMKPVPTAGQNLLLDRALEGFEGAGDTVNSMGVAALQAFKRVKSTGWILSVSLPHAEFYAPIREAQRYFVVSSVLATVLVLAMVWLLTRRLIAPLLAMTEQVRAMFREPGAGTRLPVASQDEIGVMAQAFNAMLERLSKLNAELEGRVAQLRSVITAAPLVLWSCDKNGIFTLSEGRALANMGLRPGQVVGQSVFDVHAGAPELLATVRRALAGETFVQEIGTAGRRYEVHYTPLRGEDGELAGTIGVAVDISERKKAEEALRRLNEELEHRVEQRTAEMTAARREAERANEAKSEFLSRMSHELRTPLNAILGFGQLLAFEVREREQADNVQEILRAGQHLLNLINEVLDLARIESGKFTVSLEPVALGPLIEDCMALIRPQAEANGIRMSGAVGDCAQNVLADRTRLKQVLLNLLSNAVKYNRERGTVSIDCVCTHGSARIRIRDTGSGLSAAQCARLFMPFERLDADKSDVEGTGIGLALSRRLVEHMHGRIGVDSTPGEGSSFWVELPLTDGDAAESQPAALSAQAPGEHPEAQRQWDVLCIEDNPANLRLIERILGRRPDIRLLSASTPGLGLELARTHRPALILLDINLPEMDGFEVMRCLRQGAVTCDIPVVAISANAMPADLARGEAAGFAHYLTKPLDVARLLTVTDLILGAGGGTP